MPRRRKNRGRKGGRSRANRGRGGTAQGSGRFISKISSFSIIVQPFTLRGANTLSGAISSTGGGSGISVVDGSDFAIIDNLALGGRFEKLVSNFSQCRIARGRIRYTSRTALSATNSALAQNNGFVFGWQKDPFQEPTTYQVALEMGGKIGHTDRDSVVNMGPGRWVFTELPGGATEADVRQCSHGVFFAFFPVAATGGTGTVGDWHFELDIQCRWPKDDTDAHLTRSQKISQSISNYFSQRGEDSRDYVSRAAICSDPKPHPLDDSPIFIGEERKK